MRIVGLLLAAVAVTTAAQSPAAGVAPIALGSSAFKANQPIPIVYSGYGEFKSPPLSWTGVPKAARELALIVQDDDVPMDKYSVHWLLYNIPAAASGIPAGLSTTPTLSAPAALKGATQGLNAMKRVGYLPPRPFAGSGVHHYRFHLYALDTRLQLPGGLDKTAVLAAIKGHVIGEGTLVGLFERAQ